MTSTTQPSGSAGSQHQGPAPAAPQLPSLDEMRARGAAAERARCRAIIDSQLAAGRRRLALKLALETNLEPAVAHGVLAAAAVETDPAAELAGEVVALHEAALGMRSVSPLAIAMASAPAPLPATQPVSEAELAARTVALYRQVHGLPA